MVAVFMFGRPPVNRSGFFPFLPMDFVSGRAMRPQDIYCYWKLSSKKRKKANKGRQRAIWYNKWGQWDWEDDEDEDDDDNWHYVPPKKSLWDGWQDWSGGGGGGHHERGRWTWVST